MSRQRFPKAAALLVPGVDYPKPDGCNYDPDVWTLCRACWRADVTKAHHSDTWRQWLLRKPKCQDGPKRRTTRYGPPTNCNRPAVAWLGSPNRRELKALCVSCTWRHIDLGRRYGYLAGQGLGKGSQLWVGDGWTHPAGDLLADEAELVVFAMSNPKPEPRARRLF